MSDGDTSFGKVVADWIDANQWPRNDNASPQSILVVKKLSDDPVMIQFQSAFSYFQISGVYLKSSDLLASVRIEAIAPGHPHPVTLAEASSYSLSTSDGSDISFDLDNGYVKGTVSFKYATQNNQKDIFATYSVNLPYAGDLEDTVDIAPTDVSADTGFTDAALNNIARFTSADLEYLKKALRPSKSSKPRLPAKSRVLTIAPNCTTSTAADGQDTTNTMTNEQALFVNFLKDFVVEKESVVVETFYRTSSNQWDATISFLGILELVASVDPETLTISASLFARVPIIGRVRLAGIKGSLIDGVTANFNVIAANGKATFTAARNAKYKYELFVEAEITIKFYGTIKTDGKIRIFTFPF